MEPLTLRVDNTGKRTGSGPGEGSVEQVSGPAPGERLARALVELDGDAEDLLGGVDAEVGALREVVAQQPVHVLVAGALPRRVRVAEEHAGASRGRDPLMQGQFLALIPGQRP